ncbi:MAG: phenylalanine--tRNA ligase subunit beta [Terriglobales bacterium]
MKISPEWLRAFVDLKVNTAQLADDLTLAGIAVESTSGEGDTAVFEMEIGTNRPDAMNHYGVARECSAIYNLPLRVIEPNLPQSEGETRFEIEIKDAGGCARYTARIICGVKIERSPELIAKRLQSVDQRPINNAADASNYTLWEMGHPTHAFDLDLLEGGKIIVRRASQGETLKTLDSVDRKLFVDDLIIADAKKPVALAGVMGGFDTMITAKTKNILIESAWFDPVAIRKSSRRHGLHTDASHRFERGADYGATSLACARVAQRVLGTAGGQLHGYEIDVIARALDQAPVVLRMSEVHRILGERLETSEVLRILRALGFELIPEAGLETEFTVQIPSWRLDVEREIDLIEEIARLHGYDKFPNTLPAFSGSVKDEPSAKKDRTLRTALLALGYNETISPTFISPRDAGQFSTASTIELANPLSEEASVMRNSMVPGMLNMLAYNLNRGVESVRLFESGNVFASSADESLESKQICMGAAGNAVSPHVHQSARPFSFFDLKGDIEIVLRPFQSGELLYDENAASYYVAGRAARVMMDGEMVAEFGQISAEVGSPRKLRQDIFIGEIYLGTLFKHELRRPKFVPLPKFPAVERDFSFIFEDSVIFEKIQQAIAGLGLNELRSFVPAEIFRGGSVPSGQYSILLRATFQSNDRTLREDEIARWTLEIVTALQELGGNQRA